VTPLDLLILSLFTWRGAYLLVKEDAPFRLMARIRAVTTLGGMLNCIMCASIWTALLGYVLIQTPLVPIVHIGAISGLALWAHKYTGWDYANG
jgi:hypothetical protein